MLRREVLARLRRRVHGDVRIDCAARCGQYLTAPADKAPTTWTCPHCEQQERDDYFSRQEADQTWR